MIHADVMEYPVAPLFPTMDGKPPKDAFARLVRWTFDLSGGSNTIKRTQIDDLPGEFPRFDERRAGLSYRHGYFAGITRRGADSVRFDTISHIDLASGRRADHLYDAGDSPRAGVRAEVAGGGRGRRLAGGGGLSLAPRTAATSWSTTPRMWRPRPIAVAKVAPRPASASNGNWRAASSPTETCGRGGVWMLVRPAPRGSA